MRKALPVSPRSTIRMPGRHVAKADDSSMFEAPTRV